MEQLDEDVGDHGYSLLRSLTGISNRIFSGVCTFFVIVVVLSDDDFRRAAESGRETVSERIVLRNSGGTLHCQVPVTETIVLRTYAGA